MITGFNIYDWYWTVGDSSPGAQVYSSASGGFVAVGAAAFQTWLASFGPSSVDGGVVATANNGAGLIRAECGTTQHMTTGQKVYYRGDVSGLAAAFTVTVIDATHYDLQGSTFSVADGAGSSASGASFVDTAAHLNVVLRAFGLTLLPVVQTFYSVNAVTIAGNTTLTNPLSVANVLTLTSVWAISLPPMNQANSMPIGVPFFITNDSASLDNINSFTYNDGATPISLPFTWVPGITILLTVDDNSTVNGHVRILGVFAEKGPAPVDIGGTGSSSFTVGGTVYNPGASSTSALAATAHGTIGREYRQVSGGNPVWTAPCFTTFGDGSGTIPISSASGLVFVTGTALTAPRTLTLPAANALPIGARLVIIDVVGGISATNTLSIARAGADTINGGTSSIVLNHAYAWACLASDGSSKWSSCDASDAFVGMSGDATATRAGVVTLASTIAAGGPIGDSSHVAQITYDAKGRLTTVASVAIAAVTVAGHAVSPGGSTSIASTDLSDTTSLVRTVKKQTFTSSGTYTPSSGMLYCIIECVGGGGGGGGVAGTAAHIFSASGGGSGGYSRKLATAADIGASKTVTIGAGGNGGAAGSNDGAAGGDTSVGTLCVGKGGAGGKHNDNASITSGGAGGVAGTGDVTAAGTPGQPGSYTQTVVSYLPSGNGGSSIFGGGALGVAAAPTATGNNAGNYGSGGSGGFAYQTTNTAAGGNGSGGIVIVIEFCNQ